MSDPVFVFVAVYVTTTGQIKKVARITQDVVDKQHVGWDGCDFVEVPATTTPQAHQIDIDPKSTTYLKPIARVVPTEETAAATKRASDANIADKITGGFTSSALGTPREYPSSQTDQTNLVHAAQVGGKLWSALNDVWEFLPHTADQAKQVLTDFVIMKDIARS